ncbi:MAG TPA: ribosome maturation factor RimM [Bryobacteraceae bacterium]|nr:ribosome maturation factor RimM [Bryobacteraceae bacterium]
MSDADWVTVAALIRPRGNRGELIAEPLTARPSRLTLLKTAHLFGDGKLYRVESVWFHEDVPVFKFEGVDTISDAERLRGAEVRIPVSERIALEEGEYFQSDLIGCEVRDAGDDRVIGKVTGFEEYGGPGLLEIDGGRVLIPFVKEICVEIRPEEKRIRARMPEGLETLDSDA